MTGGAKRISLAGIGAAISLIFVVLSHYIQTMSLSFNVLAAGGLMLPMYKRYYREAALGYIAVSGLGFLFVNLGVLPFVLVGGGYTLFTLFWANKGWKYALSLPVKAGYSALVFFILFKLTSQIALDPSKLSFLSQAKPYVIYLLFNAVFSAVFILYDWLLLYIYKYLSEKVFKRIIK